MTIVASEVAWVLCFDGYIVSSVWAGILLYDSPDGCELFYTSWILWT